MPPFENRPSRTALTYALASLIAGSLFVLPAPASAQPLSTRAMNRILEQGSWGPTGTINPILQTYGLPGWFDSQLRAPVSTFSDQPLLNAAGNNNTALAPVQAQFFQNAVTGQDQLRQRVAFALSEIWVVSEIEVNDAQAFPPLMRTFLNDAFGNYEQLMKDITLNPGMGKMLNMVNNDKGNPAKGTTANENYGREIMQLFTLGLQQLNIDGTPVLDSSGNPLPTYTQDTVAQMSKAFTGWTYAPPPGTVTKGHNPQNYLDPMVPVEANHDVSAKALFPGYNLPAGQTAEQDLAGAVHALFLQPTLPPFVSRLLIQHLTTSNPSPAYIARVANVFVNDGAGVRGNLERVVFAILSDPEARAGDVSGSIDSPTYGHLREPVLLLANLLRGLNGSVSASSNVASYATQLGQQLFYAPSVFSYFSPDSRAPNGLVAPEFQIQSTQSATNRVNVISTALYSGHLDAGTTFDLSAFTAAAASSVPGALTQLINHVFFHDDASDAVLNAMTAAANAVTAPADKAKAALYIALSSSEYQIIH